MYVVYVYRHTYMQHEYIPARNTTLRYDTHFHTYHCKLYLNTPFCHECFSALDVVVVFYRKWRKSVTYSHILHAGFLLLVRPKVCYAKTHTCMQKYS